MRIVLTLTALLATLFSQAQVAWIEPTFASQTDTVTVYFNAAEGNQALVGQTQVYAHTGVITDASSSPTDWRHVQGNWGTPDPNVQMTNLGGNLHKIEYRIDQFYNLPAGENVQALAFVFRTANGSLVGREADGGDIFVPLFADSFAVVLQSPGTSGIVNANQTINFEVLTQDTAEINLYVDNQLLVAHPDTTELAFSFTANAYGTGKKYLNYEVIHNGVTYRDSVYYIIQDPVVVQDPPAGTVDGLNVLSDTSIILQMTAPGKNFIYAIGDFSNWELDPAYSMKQTTDGNRWWVQINGIDPARKYRYQFHVDQEGMRVGDVYAELQLDPWNDPFIPASVYPGLPSYPTGKTTNMVSVFHLGEAEYQWDPTINYTRPAKEELVVYELLVRDFLHSHSYMGIIDTLNYLQNLGINAIELMPVNEFEGNISWGYNPAYFMAPDKYYGNKDALKMLIEECHRRGIAVLVDAVLNHSFGQNPQVMMYFDQSAGQWGQPTPDNPWFNEVAKHDFNVGYDYNHESAFTKEFMKRVIAHWVEEYRIDGYRFDLSKGFTQKNTLGSVSAWGQYDQTRIDIWEEYGNHLWNIDPDLYLVLEHFADNSEETVLSNMGFMLWGNAHYGYKEAQLGYNNGDLNAASYKARGWNNPHLVGYYTSHDEERLIYESLQYGNSTSGYNVKDFQVAIARMEMVNLFLFATPGPKMLWQFDELGYDYSINWCEDGSVNPDCRTGPKPIKWDYINNPSRARVYNMIASMNSLRNNYDVFHTDDFTMRTSGLRKSIQLNGDDFDANVLGNFGVSAGDVSPYFQSTGTWYEFFTGDSLEVTNTTAPITLDAGEYRLYTTVKLNTPDLDKPISIDSITSVDEVVNEDRSEIVIYPNPANGIFYVSWSEPSTTDGLFELFDLSGKLMIAESVPRGTDLLELNQAERLKSGIYLYRFSVNGTHEYGKVIVN